MRIETAPGSSAPNTLWRCLHRLLSVPHARFVQVNGVRAYFAIFTFAGSSGISDALLAIEHRLIKNQVLMLGQALWAPLRTR